MNPTFDAGFGVFIVLMIALAVTAVRWAIQRDRAERARRAGLVVTDDAAVERALPEGSAVEASQRSASSSTASGAASARQASGPAPRHTRAKRK